MTIFEMTALPLLCPKLSVLGTGEVLRKYLRPLPALSIALASVEEQGWPHVPIPVQCLEFTCCRKFLSLV